MNVNDVLDHLSKSFKGRDWFFDVGLDEYSRPVVYVNYMTPTVLTDVPSYVEDFQVQVHFAAAKKADKVGYIANANHIPFSTPAVPLKAVVVSPPKDETESEPDIAHLTRELDRLERICGTNILQDIFYEIHDGSNAVTNLSSRFPDVREGMQGLYKLYGFDVVYEEMDG